MNQLHRDVERLAAAGTADCSDIRAAVPAAAKLGVLATCALLALTVGCAGLGWPKTMTQEGITKQRRQRSDDAQALFDRQRDTAEYEQAKNRWVQQHDDQGCRQGLEKLLARTPRHRDARLLLAELLLTQDDPQAALGHAKAALDAYPNDAEVQFTMARVVDALGRTSDALGYYERAVKMDPSSKEFQAAYQAARESARQHVREHRSTALGENRAADDDAELTALGSAVGVVPAGYSMATAPARRSDFAAGNGSADFAGGTDGDQVADLLHVGQAALAEGDADTARGYFLQAMAAKPDDPQVPVSAAVAALRANRPALAIELLAPAAKRFPKSAAVHRALGAAYYRSGDYKSSQVALRQALSLDNSNPLSYLLMGCTLAKLGQKEAAEKNLRQARALDPRLNVTR